VDLRRPMEKLTPKVLSLVDVCRRAKLI